MATLSRMARDSRGRSFSVILASWLILFAVTAIGLRMPSEEIIPSVGGTSRLDYASRPPGLPPLSEAFVSRVLGGGSIGSSRPSGSGVAGARHDSPSIGVPADRVVVEHAGSNDDWWDPVRIRSIPFTARAQSQGSTREGDPDDCGSSGGTVWYRYRPPRDVGLIAHTYGSDHPVSLGVFTRSADGWTNVAPCKLSSSGNALLTLTGRANVTYHFQVTAPEGGGDLRFTLDPRGTFTNLSTTATGEPANEDSFIGAMPADGGPVAWGTWASNLSGDYEPSCRPYATIRNCANVYVREPAGRVRLVSRSASGEVQNQHALDHAISGDGRILAFSSNATNISSEAAGHFHLYLKDLRTGTVEAVGRPDDRSKGMVDHHGIITWRPSLSDDGRFVAFQSAFSFDDRDINQDFDVYVYDRNQKTYEWISASPLPVRVQRDYTNSLLDQSQAGDLSPAISSSGRFVVFRTDAPDLVPGDTNGTWDTFVHDRARGTIERVSISSGGEEANGPSIGQLLTTTPISADGRFVVFDSLASNLSEGDVPGTNDVFLRDRHEGTTIRISWEIDDALPLVPHYPAISPNGRFVTYTNWGIERHPDCESSLATDGYIRGYECTGSVLVYDRLTDATFPVSFLPNGDPWWGTRSFVSDNGSRVWFHSYGRDGSGKIGPFFNVFLYEAARSQ